MTQKNNKEPMLSETNEDYIVQEMWRGSLKGD